jgi:antitoxin CcdA
MMKNFKNITIKEIPKIICDCCGEQATPSDYTFHEFISINQRCGYGSIHGDGNQLSIDLCQNCFANMCGDNLTVTEPNNEMHEDIELKRIVAERESQPEIEVDIDDL